MFIFSDLSSVLEKRFILSKYLILHSINDLLVPNIIYHRITDA